MAVKIFASDRVLSDDSFLELGFDMGAARVDDYVPRFNVGQAVALLRANPELAVRFLSLTKGEGDIYWAGSASGNEVLDGKSAGVTIVHRRDGDEAIGDNAFGLFLQHVRSALRRSLLDVLVDEVLVKEGQVICDFTRKGAYLSDIEERERNGERFIHVDVYHPARFRFDSALDGTSGHAGRMSDNDVSFHRFVCPFGTSYPSQIIVGSAAEASVLYEQAIRGELDWDALFERLKERNLLDSGLTKKQIGMLVSDFRAQFDWMRDEIVFNRELKELPIVASSMMVSDSSMGRSVFDSKSAPSPADVLARYINNPLLLYVNGENGVMRSLGLLEKHEPERFVAPVEGGHINILVSGSDTIGGRQPGRKATQKIVRKETKDLEGRTIVKAERSFEIPMKSPSERDADYAAFSSRLDSILSDIGEGTTVTFVSGNSSSFANSIGVGTPRMLERYVREHGGSIGQYDFSKQVVYRTPKEQVVKNPGLSLVLMEHYADCLPVLLGKNESVTFRLDENNEDSEVMFRGTELRSDGLVCFSDSGDTGLRNVLSIASLAVDSGLPVIHVQDLQSEKEQQESLSKGALVSRSGLFVETPSTIEHIFSEGRTEWDFNELNHLSVKDDVTGLVFPVVANTYPSPVLVEGYPFASPLGVYIALAYGEMYSGSPVLSDSLKAIQKAEGSSSELIKIYEEFLGGRHVFDVLGDALQERLLREAVRRVADANTSFRELLLDLDARGIVMSSNQGATDLFVTPDGHGENRFGLAMAVERDAMRAAREARVVAEQEERAKMLDEASKRQKIAIGAKAEGQKIVGGLPHNAEEAKGAVWFIGTHDSLDFALPDGVSSFDMWDDMGGDDPLVREKVARSTVPDGIGGEVPNNFIFLFPSDLGSVTGRTRVSNDPNSRNLTGITRVNPETGEKFTAAFGIPVRFNNKGNELINDDNLPCSYRLDNNASDFVSSIVLADSRARVTAIRQGFALALPGRERSDGTSYYTLGQVFMPMQYSVKEKKMVPNPHQSPLCLSLVESYISILENGRNFPLNCIRMPRSHYLTQDDTVVRKMVSEGKRFISAEGRFISDLMMSLQIANATALALGVPLRFPLDKDGHIDLGPGVPEEFRMMAEKRIDSFIGVRQSAELASGCLPLLERIPMYETGAVRDLLVKSGTDLYMRPNELAVAFGPYDFSGIFSGTTVPLHEMAFRMEDGTIFTVKDSKSTKSVKDKDEINKFLSYSKNDVRRFLIRTTDLEKVPEFLSLLKAYSERANAIKVSARLVTEAERPDGGLDGYVNLLSSNSEEYAISEHDIGKEVSVFNAVSRVRQEVERDEYGNIKKVFDVLENERNINGEKTSGVYYGKIDAKDGFKGYAQIKYVLPDGQESGWMTITDLNLAKDTVMSLVSRTYGRDDYVVPPMNAMEIMWKAEAVKFSGDAFRELVWTPPVKKFEFDDDKVVELVRVPNKGNVPSETVELVQSGQVSHGEESIELEPYEPSVVSSVSELVFSESEGGYSQRTRENATADDIDFTLALAIDMDTYGERLTKKVAGESYIGIKVSDFSDRSVDEAVRAFVDMVPEEFFKGEIVSLNCAGNGLYTLNAHGISQEQCDEFMVKFFAGIQAKGAKVGFIRSGGQTGVDESSLVAAEAFGIPCECHAPKGWLMRDASGRDLKDESAFKSRFDNKNLKKLLTLVKPSVVKKNQRKLN